MSSQDAINEFMRDHPERRQGFSEHPELGLLMDNETTLAFIDWTVAKGYTTPKKAAKAKRMMRDATHPERN